MDLKDPDTALHKLALLAVIDAVPNESIKVTQVNNATINFFIVHTYSLILIVRHQLINSF